MYNTRKVAQILHLTDSQAEELVKTITYINRNTLLERLFVNIIASMGALLVMAVTLMILSVPLIIIVLILTSSSHSLFWNLAEVYIAVGITGSAMLAVLYLLKTLAVLFLQWPRHYETMKIEELQVSMGKRQFGELEGLTIQAATRQKLTRLLQIFKGGDLDE